MYLSATNLMTNNQGMCTLQIYLQFNATDKNIYFTLHLIYPSIARQLFSVTQFWSIAQSIPIFWVSLRFNKYISYILSTVLFRSLPYTSSELTGWGAAALFNPDNVWKMGTETIHNGSVFLERWEMFPELFLVNHKSHFWSHSMPSLLLSAGDREGLVGGCSQSTMHSGNPPLPGTPLGTTPSWHSLEPPPDCSNLSLGPGRALGSHK